MSLVNSYDTKIYTKDFFYLNVILCPLVNAQRRCHRETLGEMGEILASVEAQGIVQAVQVQDGEVKRPFLPSRRVFFS